MTTSSNTMNPPFTISISLTEQSTLASVAGTRQSLDNTRQTICWVWHSTKRTQQWIVHQQLFLCRVLPSDTSHSAKKSRRDSVKWWWQSRYRMYSLVLSKVSSSRPHASLCLETHKLSLGIVNLRQLQTAADDALSSVNVCRESFTECVYAEHSALGKITHRRAFSFAECSTWQSKFCRVHDKFPSTKN